ncbi:MAG: recombination regulator RecX [Acidaminococcus provencensis]|jgi:regulatory protein|uniref:regulatory protein RecX n=1 Tax=Acidaminococcus TaxID=904 RepID=UPI000CF9517D|nr:MULTISPECIES: regulatory protein RecX [Acidaminococcus]MCH4096401.1 recombination regulator RecX [Acidaminococcus provencensis]RHK02920.1 regulatory protein RecX [Acidaminococcus sp. AM05-11]
MWNKSGKALGTYAEAYNFALDKLSLRDFTRFELRDKLLERECPEDLADQVLAKLTERHFLDDARCAARITAAWRGKRFYGRQYLRLMLSKKQVPQELIQEELAQVTEEEETERACDWARTQLGKFQRKYKADPRKGKAALSRGLASRGFGFGAIASALQLWQEAGGEEDLF